MSNVVNAKDAGCKLDGQTDDTATLVAAANQAASSGKPLYVPAGVCIVTSASLPSGLTMYGDGMGATTFRRKPSAGSSSVVPVLSFTDGNAITLYNFSIDGNKAGQPNPEVAQSVNLQLAGCSRFLVHDISSQGSQWGMWVAGTKDTVATTGSSIVNCRCFDNGLGIWIFGSVAALTVSGNTIYNNSGGGIWFYSPNGADRSITDIICNSNRLDNNGQQGLILWGKGWQGLSGYDFDKGLGILQVDRFECSYNEVSRSETYGMMIQARNGRVIGNQCYENGRGGWAGIDCTSESTHFEANQCDNNGDIGIDAGGCLACTFVGNICRNNGSCGLNLGGNRNCEARGNILENNGWKAGPGLTPGLQISLLRFEEANNVNAFPWDARDCALIDNAMWIPPRCVGIWVGQDPWRITLSGNVARNVTGSNAFVVESTSVSIAANRDQDNLASPNAIRSIATNNDVIVIPPHVDRFTLVSGNSAFVGDIYTDWTLASYRTVYAVRMIDRGAGYTDPDDAKRPTVTVAPSSIGNAPAVAAITDCVDGLVANCILWPAPGAGYTAIPTVDIAAPAGGGRKATARAYLSGIDGSTQNAQINSMTLAIQIRIDKPMVFGSNAGMKLAGDQNATFKNGDYLFLKGGGARWVETARVVTGDGALLRDDTGAIFVIYGGAKFHVPDMATYNRLFPNGGLQAISRDATAGIATAPIDGTLLREESGAIWVIYGGAKFQVPDMATWNRLFAGGGLHQLWDGALAGIDTVPIYDAIFREESGAIWVVFGRAKFRVPDMATYNRLFGGDTLHPLWDGALAGVPGTPIDGSLLREENGAIWVIYGGAKFQVPDMATWNRLFAGGGLHQLWDGALAGIGQVPADGTLLREESSRQVYVMAGGHKQPVVTSQTRPACILWNGALSHVP